MKFEQINKVEIDGNVFNNSNLEIFPIQKEKTCRICNIYGKNGSGKSTISKAIKYNGIDNITMKYYDKENNEIICDSTDKIYVYNEEFIDEKVKTSKEGIKTVIMFGKQKQLDDEIIVLKDDLKILKQEENKIILEIEKSENSEDITNPKYYKNLIEQILKETWAVRDKKIRNNQRNSAVQYNIIIPKIISGKNENISKEELVSLYNEQLNIYKQVSDGNIKILDKLDKITIFSRNQTNLNLLLQKKIDKPQFTDREKFILEKIENGEQKFYESVREEIENVDFCPYCFQNIKSVKDEIISSINKVLNEEVDLHKGELKKIRENYCEIIELNENLKKVDDKLFLEANTIIGQLNNKVIEINRIIDIKIDNIYTPREKITDEVLILEKKLNVIIEKIEIKRDIFNKAIEDKENIKELLNNLNLQISWYEINDNYKLLETYEIKYKEKLEEKKSNIDKISEKEEKIRKLEGEKQNVKIANDKINIFLEYIFMSKDKLKIEYDNIKKIYLVKSHGKDIKPKDLSTGERNIIALCYFFIKILENTSEEEEFREECFVVLDDPISSFDLENKVGLYTFLRMMFNKIIRNNPDSKIINFTHSLETMYNLEKICSDIKSRYDFQYYLCQLCNSKLYLFEYKRNDYKKMINDIYEYANIKDSEIENVLDDTIGNTMRKLLEAYATFNYNKGIEEITRDEKILEKIQDKDIRQYFENFMYRLILNNESHTEQDTKNLEFFDYISRNEKIKTAKSILMLLNLLDDIHLSSYFDNQEYIEKLQEWEKEIIPKK